MLKVKEIYFNENMPLPVFVLENGDEKYPYQKGNVTVWLTEAENVELEKQIAESKK